MQTKCAWNLRFSFFSLPSTRSIGMYHDALLILTVLSVWSRDISYSHILIPFTTEGVQVTTALGESCLLHQSNCHSFFEVKDGLVGNYWVLSRGCGNSSKEQGMSHVICYPGLPLYTWRQLLDFPWPQIFPFLYPEQRSTETWMRRTASKSLRTFL